MKRTYEGLIVINTRDNEKSPEELSTELGHEIESEGAKLEEVQHLGRHQFAYNAQHLDGGHYVNYIFQAEPSVIEALKSKFRLNDLVHLQHYQRLA